MIKPVRRPHLTRLRNLDSLKTTSQIFSGNGHRQSRTISKTISHHVKSLAALNAVAATVSQSLDLETTLNVALNQALEVIGVEAGGISLVDEEAGELVMRVHRGWRQPELADAMRVKLGQGMSGQVIASGQILVTGDVRGDPRLAVPAFGREGVQTMALAPMRAHNKVVGVLSAMSYQPHVFSPDDLKLLAAIADQVGVAIDNARLYENTRRRLDELTMLHQVSLAAISTLELAKVIKRIVGVLQSSLGFEYIGLFLVNEAERSAKLYATSGLEGERARNVSIPFGQGIVGYVVVTGRLLRVGNVAQEPRYWPDIPNVRSEMAVPLSVGGTIIGAIDVQSSRQDAFTADDERVLVTAAGQLAVIIQNARLYAETRRRLDERTILSEVALAGASTLDLDQVLDRMLRVIRRTLNVESFEFIMVDSSCGILHTEISYGTPPHVVNRDLNIGEGVVGWVAEHGFPVLVKDVRREPRYLEANFRTRSELAVPLKVGGETIGVLNAESWYVNRFTEDDQHLLEVLAGQMAVIIQNARLYAETQRRLAHVTTLYTFAQQLKTSLDMNVVLDSIVVSLKQVLDCRAANIWLLNPETQMLEIRAAAGLKTKWKREARLKIGEGIAGKVAATAQPIYVPDTHEIDFIFFDSVVRSLLCVPLVAHEHVIGALAIDSDKPDAFTSDDEVLLTIVAAQASVAIDNARLFTDVTERAHMLEQAYSDLQENDRLKDELVQNVSHELRTPLTFIKGYIELLLEEEMGSINETQRRSLNVVADKADTIARLVNDIVFLQQIERGSLELAPLDLSELARDILHDFSQSEQALKFSVEASPDLPCVIADGERIKQVFNNLLGNAVKFSPDGGQVTVRLQDMEKDVWVAVRDTGIGIPQHLLEKIFERFYQVDGSSTRRYGGAGLGLAIVKRIVEAHGGRVWAESQQAQPGDDLCTGICQQGSSFYFTLPKDGPVSPLSC